MRKKPLLALITVVIAAPMLASCASTPHSQTPPEGIPVKVSLCQVLADPVAYDRTLIEVTGNVSRGFEDFTLSDSGCERRRTDVWLEIGGRVNSRTTYCCGVSTEPTRAKPLVVEGVQTTILQDQAYRRFQSKTRALHAFHTVPATLVGRYFAGAKQTLPGGTFWQGYGHMGMYSLLVIEQVVQVSPSK